MVIKPTKKFMAIMWGIILALFLIAFGVLDFIPFILSIILYPFSLGHSWNIFMKSLKWMDQIVDDIGKEIYTAMDWPIQKSKWVW
jgi:hypothetical protein